MLPLIWILPCSKMLRCSLQSNEETDKEKERTSGILYVTPRNENSTNVRKKTMNRSKVKNHLKSYRK